MITQTASADITSTFKQYEKTFKALADEKRLKLLNLLADSPEDAICVCDLMDAMEMAQSKLSYHLKILLQANLILQEKKGTWHYYSINNEVMNSILSEELCCLFRKADTKKTARPSCGCAN
ncbi:ArsR/SmtB family transcription factor [Ornithinibacillus contaminans]|uniref:ArsR/SmtB family transcription factor n=1 Tax=Ornithinibacillus contaminans TaxID=694055 RepID=UPI00064D805B|nr:metalloregulator ArsR/SmtB family transcription factor [Ornithinibacillus contaminans]